MKSICKRLIATIIIISLVSSSGNINLFAKSVSDATETEEKRITPGELGGYLEAGSKAIKKIYSERTFISNTGHGFAAEQANNLSDLFKGKKAKVIGGDNVKNGPDRQIKNRDGSVTWIQDKYYNSAKNSVNAAFDSETGMYRYKTSDGKPMTLEVPKDQYKKAVEEFAEKIKAGKVEGVNDPKEAKNIVKKGNVTYKQAVNITKAFNKDSLIYDAKNGVITATCAVGISFVLNYASCILSGKSNEEAIKDSCMGALQSGGEVLGAYVIASQLVKTSLPKAMAPASKAVVKCFGEKFAKSLLKSVGQNTANLTKSEVIERAGEALSRKALFNIVFVVVLEIPDIVDLFRGRISKEQFIKNLSVTLVSLGGAAAGGKIGAAIGSSVAPGVGTVVGVVIGVIGGAAAGAAAEKISSYIYEGDAEKMFSVVTEEFQKLGEECLITEDEADEIAEEIKDTFDTNILKEMYSSKDWNEYARNKLEPYFENKVAKRGKIKTPSEDEIRKVYKNNLNGVIFIH